MKKNLFPLCIVLVFVPMTASALWWNPFTWKIFQRQEPIAQFQTTTEITPEEKIDDLQKQLNDLQKQQASSTTAVVPQTTIQATKKEVKKSVPNPVIVTDICPEIEGVQTVVPNGYIKNKLGQCELVNADAHPQTNLIENNSIYDQMMMKDINNEDVKIVQDNNYKILRKVRANKDGQLGIFDKNTKIFISDKEAYEIQIRNEEDQKKKDSDIQRSLENQTANLKEITDGQIVKFYVETSMKKQSVDTYRTKVRATVKRADGKNPVLVCIDKNTLYNKVSSDTQLQSLFENEYNKGNTMKIYADVYIMETPTVLAIPDIVCGARVPEKNNISNLKYFWMTEPTVETRF